MDQENTANAALEEIAEDKRAQLDFAMRDLDEFLARHPQVDVERLMGNAGFLRFCGTRMGREPLAALYDDFAALMNEAGEAAAARLRSRDMRSTGGGTALGAALSPAQKYVLDAWNAEHPEMAMTAREFLGR